MGSSSFKQKENLSENSADESIFVKPLMKSRKQQLAEKYQRKAIGNIDDIRPFLQKLGAIVVNQVETLPQSDYSTYDADTWRKMNDKNSSYNRRSGDSRTWH